MRLLSFLTLGCLLAAALPTSSASAQEVTTVTDLTENVVQPGAECAPLWNSESATAFVDLLVRATVATSPVWVDYEAADGAFVLHAGNTDTGGACVGVWRGGQALSFATLPDPPRLLTPLYGYHLPEEGNGGPMDELADASAQPEAIRAWLEEAGVESAVLVPVEVEDFPFELSAHQKVKLAIHEGFHVDVQMPRWRGFDGDWPAWDLQPDRPGVRECYVASPAVESALVAERDALDDLINSLLDDEPAAACEAGEAFLEYRALRYEALSMVEVSTHDGSAGSCREAETLMELEEGVADYVSLTRMFDLGLASREQLMRRYNAQQHEVFYLTGSMQLHAVSIMLGDRINEITRFIARSESPDEGSLTSVFRSTLATFCSAR